MTKKITTRRTRVGKTMLSGALVAAVGGALLLGGSTSATAAGVSGNSQAHFTKVDAETGAPLAGAVYEVTFDTNLNQVVRPETGLHETRDIVDLLDYDTIATPSHAEWGADAIAASQTAHDAAVAARQPLEDQLVGLPTQEDADTATAAYTAWRTANGIDALEADAAAATKAHDDLVAEYDGLNAIPAAERTQAQLDRLKVLKTTLPGATQAAFDANAAVTTTFSANGNEGLTLRETATNATNGVAKRAALEATLATYPPVPPVLTPADLDATAYATVVDTYTRWNTQVTAAHDQGATNVAAGLPTTPTVNGTLHTYTLITDANGRITFPVGASTVFVPASVTEKIAPTGYDLDSTTYTGAFTSSSIFSIAGQSVNLDGGFTLTNAKTPVTPTPPTTPEQPVAVTLTTELAHTGADADALFIGAAALLLGLIGTATATILRRRQTASK